MRTEKIFTVAWDFYPKVSGESVVCKRALTNSKFEYDVISGYFGEDEQQIENCHVYPIKGEKYFIFTKKALKLFRKLNSLNDYRLLYTRVMPSNAHFTGTIVKLFYPKLKWIVYFSDPIWNSPFISSLSFLQKDKKARPRYLVMKFMGIFSKIAVKKSDLLVFNNIRLAKHVLGKKYSKYSHKIAIVPYGHEGVRVNSEKRKLKAGKYCFAHVGQIYSERNLENIIEAIKRLRDYHQELYNRILIYLVGYIDEYNINLIKQNNLESVFEIIGQVSYEESLQYMSNADCLLLIDTNFKDKRFNIFTPSKVFDYMASGNLIFAITNPDTAATDVTVPSNIITAAHKADEVYECIYKIITSDLKPDLDLYEKFNCRNSIDILDKKIGELIGG